MKLDFKNIKKYCINLQSSELRKRTVSAEFKNHGIDVEFFTAIDKNDIIVPELSPKISDTEAPGKLACAMSHISVIQKAKDLGLPSVCVFEDDVIFCDDFHERIKYIESLPNFDFDILSLGGHFSKNLDINEAEKTEYPYIYKTKVHAGTYALIFTEQTYDFILRNWHYGLGSDEFYGNHVYREFKSYAMVPFLVGCNPCVSDILGFYWKYENVGWYYQQHPLLNLSVKSNIYS